MIKIVIDDYIKIKGHGDSKTCIAVTCVAQYICSCLDIIDYASDYGYLYAKYVDNELSYVLISKFIDFIKKMNTTEIYMEVLNEAYN